MYVYEYSGTTLIMELDFMVIICILLTVNYSPTHCVQWLTTVSSKYAETQVTCPAKHSCTLSLSAWQNGMRRLIINQSSAHTTSSFHFVLIRKQLVKYWVIFMWQHCFIRLQGSEICTQLTEFERVSGLLAIITIHGLAHPVLNHQCKLNHFGTRYLGHCRCLD